ncbi:MAG: hypothetical protein ACW981_15995 [Candidatus Hodarchaeales archaeon]
MSFVDFVDYKKMFLLQTVIAGIYGVLFLLFPKELGELMAFTPYTVELAVTARFFGVALIGVALLSLVFSTVNDPTTLRNAGIAMIIGDGIGLLLVVYGAYINVGNLVFMANSILYAILVVGFLYLLIVKPDE